MPADDFARTIREDTKRQGLLFLGTENGIYVSFDDGADVAVAAAGTAGHAGPRDRSARETTWSSPRTADRSTVMDNISVLRQSHARRHTNEPVVAVSTRLAPLRSVSRGVAIDYYLKAAADKVTIEILDAQGRDHSERSPARRLSTNPSRPRRPERRR